MPFQLLETVQSAKSLQQLAALHPIVGELARRTLNQNEDLWPLMADLTEYHDAVGLRVLTIVKQQLERDGVTEPNVPCCWLVLGSRGRGEQGIWTDQDTALIYSTSELSRCVSIDEYYSELSERFARAMLLAGYPECTGFVLARNPRWRGTPSQWRTRLTEYMEVPTWDNVRFLMLATDMRTVCGDASLHTELHHWLALQLKARPFIHWQVADHEANHPVAIDFFHRFQTIMGSPYKGLIDVKNGLYMQIANALRLWGVSIGASSSSSRGRLRAAAESGGLDPQLTLAAERALRTAIRARLTAQLHAASSGEEANYLDLRELSKQQVEQLRSAMLTVRHLQQLNVKQFRKRGEER